PVTSQLATRLAEVLDHRRHLGPGDAVLVVVPAGIAAEVLVDLNDLPRRCGAGVQREAAECEVKRRGTYREALAVISPPARALASGAQARPEPGGGGGWRASAPPPAAANVGCPSCWLRVESDLARARTVIPARTFDCWPSRAGRDCHSGQAVRPMRD